MITKKQRKQSCYYNLHRGQAQHFHTPEPAKLFRGTWLKNLFRRVTP